MARRRIYGGGGSGEVEDGFARRLHSLMLGLGWNQSDVIRAGKPFVPRGHRWARDLISSWIRAEALPNPVNLDILSKVFNVPVEELLPRHKTVHVAGRDSNTMQLTTGKDGMARIKLDMDLPADVALEVMTLIQKMEKPISGE